MTDKENVIKRLEECLSASCRGFRTCPYGDDGWDAVKAALTLLREQEPVESNKPGAAYKTTLACGVCAYPIPIDWWVTRPSCEIDELEKRLKDG